MDRRHDPRMRWLIEPAESQTMPPRQALTASERVTAPGANWCAGGFMPYLGSTAARPRPRPAMPQAVRTELAAGGPVMDFALSSGALVRALPTARTGPYGRESGGGASLRTSTR